MPVTYPDPGADVLNEIRRIQTMQPADIFDEKETAERVEAAQAYAGESEQHFVDWAMDCIDASVKAKREIREVQDLCWNTFKEKEPASYAGKEAWQSRVIVPKPFASVMYGAASVKKAFSPNFLSIEKHGQRPENRFWQAILNTALGKKFANFPIRYIDALVMALAVGESMEMIPRFSSGSGLEIDLVEPWKIQRDPDAPPRDPQGGLYWIHQEWLDYFVLKEGEGRGQYFDVSRVKAVEGEDSNNPFMTREAISRRKEMIWDRSRFRSMHLTSEFWGTVISPRGELLLKNATYTVCGGRVIQLPEASPYEYLRWPGTMFSALPDLLKFGGRGLLEGVIRVWETMNNILCLHEDYLKWIVNPSKEINVDGLVDPTDTEDIPGKEFLTRDTPHGQQVVRMNDRRDTTGSVLSNMQYHDQLFQHGSMITDAVQGLPGWRQEMTARESAQNLDQSMGVFSLMGVNMQDGAVNAIYSVYDVLRTFATRDDFMELVKSCDDELAADVMDMARTGEIPELSGKISVSGMETIMRDSETLNSIMQYLMPLKADPDARPFFNTFDLIKAVEKRTNLQDEKIIVTPEEGKQIQEQIRQQAIQIAAMQMAAQQQGGV